MCVCVFVRVWSCELVVKRSFIETTAPASRPLHSLSAPIIRCLPPHLPLSLPPSLPSLPSPSPHLARRPLPGHLPRLLLAGPVVLCKHEQGADRKHEPLARDLGRELDALLLGHRADERGALLPLGAPRDAHLHAVRRLGHAQHRAPVLRVRHDPHPEALGKRLGERLHGERADLEHERRHGC